MRGLFLWKKKLDFTSIKMVLRFFEWSFSLKNRLWFPAEIFAEYPGLLRFFLDNLRPVIRRGVPVPDAAGFYWGNALDLEYESVKPILIGELHWSIIRWLFPQTHSHNSVSRVYPAHRYHVLSQRWQLNKERFLKKVCAHPFPAEQVLQAIHWLRGSHKSPVTLFPVSYTHLTLPTIYSE